jgi:hypothetical protein
MKLGPFERSYHPNYRPLTNAGHDDSIPDREDHAKHLASVLRASPRGFAWIVDRRRP